MAAKATARPAIHNGVHFVTCPGVFFGTPPTYRRSIFACSHSLATELPHLAPVYVEQGDLWLQSRQVGFEVEAHRGFVAFDHVVGPRGGRDVALPVQRHLDLVGEAFTV